MKPRILIVDDEETIRYFLRLELEQLDYEVWDAATGEKAMQLLDTHSFDVILLDLRLPGIGGLKVMRYCKQTSPHTSIIIITAYATLDSAIDALKHGAHDYILKPFNTAQVLASVASGIARRGERLPLAAHQTESKIAGPLKLDPKGRQIYLNDTPLKLTPTEF
ncbi:MAG: response regulator transcription factor, partial [Anaerolineae bacterium]